MNSPSVSSFPFGLGWRRDREDFAYLRRNEGRIMRSIPVGPEAPSVFDPRPWLVINNQKRMGSCSGQARVACREVLYHTITKGGVIQFSPMYAYTTGQKADGLLGEDQGATISGSVRGAKEYGECLETTFPYPEQYTSEIPQAAIEEGKAYRNIVHESLSTYDDCWRWLTTMGPIEIGIPWVASHASNTTGIIESASGQNYGGHALAIVGWVEKVDSQGRKYLILINSHDLTWGYKGTAIVAPSMYDKWGRDGYSEMIGLSDKNEYEPGRFDWVKNNPFAR